MSVKGTLTAVCLATGLLLSPLQTSRENVGFGAASALAEQCRLEVELCQEIDLVFYKTRACWTVRLFC